jgi:hypothetical protein
MLGEAGSIGGGGKSEVEVHGVKIGYKLGGL